MALAALPTTPLMLSLVPCLPEPVHGRGSESTRAGGAQTQTVPYLIDNPEVGYVQTRWVFVNPDESYLTKVGRLRGGGSGRHASFGGVATLFWLVPGSRPRAGEAPGCVRVAQRLLACIILSLRSSARLPWSCSAASQGMTAGCLKASESTSLLE